jgi:hypothetical protein
MAQAQLVAPRRARTNVVRAERCDHTRGAALNGLCRGCGVALRAPVERPAEPSVSFARVAVLLPPVALTLAGFFTGGLAFYFAAGVLFACLALWQYSTGEEC